MDELQIGPDMLHTPIKRPETPEENNNKKMVEAGLQTSHCKSIAIIGSTIASVIICVIIIGIVIAVAIGEHGKPGIVRPTKTPPTTITVTPSLSTGTTSGSNNKSPTTSNNGNNAPTTTTAASATENIASSAPCPCEQICEQSDNGYSCSCNDGFVLNDDEIGCTVCTCDQVCVGVLSSYTCDCNDGFALANDGTTCEACPCEQVCEKDGGGAWVCSCRDGYEMDAGDSCQDIDECITNNGGCEQDCTNTLGSFVCSCPEIGKVLQDDGLSCAYDYDEVLRLSLLFYEAQRSGVLPADNRVPWRGDSATDDATPNGEDLSGGYYDAGDHLKLGLPMAFSATVLAWGFIEFEDAYEAAGQVDNMLACLKWFSDYFIKCHTQEHEFYAQVGLKEDDHFYWGRAEEMTMDRPAFKVDETNPGTDVVCATAAAMAAISIVFKDIDPSYAATLVTHAEQLYEFGDNFRGYYSNSIVDAAELYKSTSYVDDLCFAACWLHYATGESTYLDQAVSILESQPGNKPYSFGWGDVTVGYRLMVLKLTGETSTYKTLVIDKFLTGWQQGNDLSYTPNGMVFRHYWGSLRYSTSTSFIALSLAEAGPKRNLYRSWAKEQVDIALGDAGRSYVVGFGTNPPQNPHHRGSSCPDLPASCGWPEYGSTDPNPQILYGALVGGPDENGNYSDTIDNYFQNEVTLDFNAGFQSAVAGLRHLQLIGQYP
ncbi:uncharacterized protein LOC100367086 [Saccoglossus kowalevskii]